MAKSAFQKRFPYGRLFLLVAILIALPIVLWSVQKAQQVTLAVTPTKTALVLRETCADMTLVLATLHVCHHPHMSYQPAPMAQHGVGY